MTSLAGQTVIVTGSGAGLGRVLAKTYLEAGANVVICDISGDRVKTTAAELETAHAGRVHSVVVDVADEESVAALFASTVSAFGRVDVLVNNAGILDAFDGVATLSKATWDRVMAVNALGPFLTSRAAVNQFLAQGDDGPARGGVIINIASTASLHGGAAGAAYTASKHALVGLTKNTAGNYASRGVSAIALSLGGMRTEIGRGQPPAAFNMDGFNLMRTTLSGFDPEVHGVELEDVGKYCVFLSDRRIAATSNGSNIVFNGNFPGA